MLSLSLNTPPQAQLEALRLIRICRSFFRFRLSVLGPLHRTSDPVSDSASASDSPSLWYSAEFARPARSSYVLGRMSRFPDIFCSSRTSGVSERVGSSGSSVFRHFPDGSGLRLFCVPEFSGIPAESDFCVASTLLVGSVRSLGPSQLPCCRGADASSASFWSAWVSVDSACRNQPHYPIRLSPIGFRNLIRLSPIGFRYPS
jgi:hypothetical protein